VCEAAALGLCIVGFARARAAKRSVLAASMVGALALLGVLGAAWMGMHVLVVRDTE
jgi:hypothetical protein